MSNVRKKSRKTKSRTTAEDRELGRRLKIMRLLKGFSMKDVAEQVELTFQQIQKYERGANRVSAVRLRKFCQVYNKPYSFFLDHLDKPVVFDDSMRAAKVRFQEEEFFFETLTEYLEKYQKLLTPYEQLPDEIQDLAIQYIVHMSMRPDTGEGQMRTIAQNSSIGFGRDGKTQLIDVPMNEVYIVDRKKFKNKTVFLKSFVQEWMGNSYGIPSGKMIQ